jgi:MFS family permease
MAKQDDATRKRFALAVAFACVIADYIAVGMMRTVLPFYARKLGGGAFLVSSLEAVYGVGQVIGALTLGRLSDRLGRRFVLAISFAGSIIGYSIAGLATTPMMLLVSRLPVGLSKQTVTIARTIVADCTNENERSEWMAYLVTATAIGYTIGPALGGKLADEYGDSIPPAVAVCITGVLFPVVMSVLPETSPSCVMGDKDSTAQSKKKTEREAAKPSVPWSALVLMGILAIPEFALVVQSSTGLSMFVIEHLQRSKTFFGLLNSGAAAGAAVMSATVLPYLTKKCLWSDGFLLMCAYSCMGLGSLLVFSLGSVEALFYFAPPMSFAIAVMRSSPASLISKSAGESVQGHALGLLDFSSSACRIVAPLIAGSLVEMTTGVLAPWAMNSALCASGCVGLLIYRQGGAAAPPAAKKGK